MKIICVENTITEKQDEGIPFIIKPETSLIQSNLPFFIPDYTTEITCSITFVLRICKIGKHIQEKFASAYYDQIAAGIDFTAEDVLRKKLHSNLPTSEARVFDGSCNVGKFTRTELINKETFNIKLLINETPVQQQNLSNLPYTFEEIISYVSQFTMLKIGDYIFTGFVGKTQIATEDVLEAFIDNDKLLQFKIK